MTADRTTSHTPAASPAEAAAETTAVRYYRQSGPTIGVTSAPVIEQDGLYFRDLARTGTLLPFEDWRLPAVDRARDLASRLASEQIAGLMLYSPHQAVPAPPAGPFPGTYGGAAFAESGAKPWQLTDQQRHMIAHDHVRHVLAINLESARTAARWNNELQALAESQPFGVPISIATDPRHGAGGDAGAEFATSAVDVSRWPEGIGMAALFDPEALAESARIIAAEYRALGITTALGPQIDLATDPRWMRLQDTWGPHEPLVTDYARAYCDAMQTTLDPAATSPADPGWGWDSVATMIKHWPGGGTGEAGRDAHYGFGKFAIYPDGNEAEHLRPFTEGALALPGPTGAAAAVMPYYTISWHYRTPEGQILNDGEHSDGNTATPRANSYNKAIVQGMLRQAAGYRGVVCTDWGITADPDPEIGHFGQRCYGVEELSVAERHALAIDNGVDQFGGNSEAAPILEAWRIIAERDGEEVARARFEESATRLLTVFFRTGLFDNPYLDAEASAATVGCASHVQAAQRAQRGSLVMLKNSWFSGEKMADGVPAAAGVAPLPLGHGGVKVWVPGRHVEAQPGFMRFGMPARDVDPYQASPSAFERVESPAEADAAVVFIESPLSEMYAIDDREAGGNGYLPLSLQWGPYVAEHAREHSLAQGDFREAAHPDRSVRGKAARVYNAGDAELVRQAREVMGERPIIVVVRMHNPAVLAEIEPFADAIIVDFGVDQETIWQLLRGDFAPSGLLPLTLPANMRTVEEHCEDCGDDLEPYTDACGHRYDLAFGLTWGGVINDARVARYGRGVTPSQA